MERLLDYVIIWATITMFASKNKERKPKNYTPDPLLIYYLNQELQFVNANDGKASAGEMENVSKRNKKSKNRPSRKKVYWIDKLFQEFADVVYFLKFVEEHRDEFDDLFEKDLEEFFGVLRPNPKEDEEDKQNTEESEQNATEESNQNPTCIFDEFIKASLSLRSLHAKNPVDFRIILINIMITNITAALQFQMKKSKYMSDMLHDSHRFSMWAEMLEDGLKKAQDKNIWRRYKI